MPQRIIEPISEFVVRDYAIYILNSWQEENLELIHIIQHLNNL